MLSSTRLISRSIIVLSLVLGLVCAGALSFIALDHNPQQEFRDTEGIVWDSLAPMTLVGFVLGSGITLALSVATSLIMTSGRSLRSNT